MSKRPLPFSFRRTEKRSEAASSKNSGKRKRRASDGGDSETSSQSQQQPPLKRQQLNVNQDLTPQVQCSDPQIFRNMVARMA